MDLGINLHKIFKNIREKCLVGQNKKSIFTINLGCYSQNKRR